MISLLAATTPAVAKSIPERRKEKNKTLFWWTFARPLTTGRKTWQSGAQWARLRWTSPPCRSAWRARPLHRRGSARKRTVTTNKLNSKWAVWDSVQKPWRWWIPVGERTVPAVSARRKRPTPRLPSYRPSRIYSFKHYVGRNLSWSHDLKILSLLFYYYSSPACCWHWQKQRGCMTIKKTNRAHNANVWLSVWLLSLFCSLIWQGHKVHNYRNSTHKQL